MSRIRAKLSLAAALVGGALAVGQDAPKPAAAKETKDAKENVLSLVPEGQQGRRCKVLRVYKHSSGATAYEVKAEDTGEVMTVIDGVASDGKKDVKIEPKKDAKTAAKAETKSMSVKQASAKVSADGPKLGGDDPLLSPKGYTGNAKVIKEFSDDGKSPESPMPAGKTVTVETRYVTPPVPASQRWFPFVSAMKLPAKPVAQARRMPMAVPMAMPMPSAEVGPAVPPAVMAATSPDPVVRLIGRLHDDLLPSMREISACQLAYYGRGRADAYEALVEVAQNDAAPSVRSACVRCLGEMRAKTPATMAMMQTMAQADADEGVRQAAMTVMASW
jgi:hypothetical protein